MQYKTIYKINTNKNKNKVPTTPPPEIKSPEINFVQIF